MPAAATRSSAPWRSMATVRWRNAKLVRLAPESRIRRIAEGRSGAAAKRRYTIRIAAAIRSNKAGTCASIELKAGGGGVAGFTVDLVLQRLEIIGVREVDSLSCRRRRLIGSPRISSGRRPKRYGHRR